MCFESHTYGEVDVYEHEPPSLSLSAPRIVFHTYVLCLSIFLFHSFGLLFHTSPFHCSSVSSSLCVHVFSDRKCDFDDCRCIVQTFKASPAKD